MKVLIVDGDSDSLEQTKMSLEKKDSPLNIDTAISVNKALELLDENDYDAIVSDYQLPEVDSLELLKVIRKEKESEALFIVFTEMGKEEVSTENPKLERIKNISKRLEENNLSIRDKATAIDGKKIIEQSPLPTFVIDSEGFVVMVNEAFLKAYSVSNEEKIIGENALTESANIKHGVVKYMKEALNGEVVETPEIDFVTPHGKRRVTKSRLFPIFDKDDNLTHVVVMHEDITERKLAEEEQHKAEKEAATANERAKIIEAIPEIIFILDKDLNLLDWNETALDRTGYSSEEAKGVPVLEFFTETDREKVSEGLKETIKESRASWEGKLITKNGEEIPHSWSASSIRDKEGNLTRIVGVGRDITDRKKAEEKLRKSREKYRTLTETANEIILTHNMEKGDITYANNGASEQLGYEVEEILEMNLYDLIPEDEIEKIKEIEKRRKDGDSTFYQVETKAMRKDGTIFPVKASSKPISFTDTGKPENILVIAQNITSRKESEEREKFLHSLIRHDVKNKAQIVQGYLELSKDTELSEDQEELIEKAIRSSKKGIDIIEKVRTLRELTGKQEIRKIELCSLIENVIEENQKIFEKTDIELNCQKEEMEVQGGPLLEELFSNLLENAIIHADCDIIRISVEKSGEGILVKVEDDGKGISEEDKERIFEKGYKSGETGGSGLGLYLVEEIVESYGGSVEVKDSELGGARFDVHLKKA